MNVHIEDILSLDEDRKYGMEVFRGYFKKAKRSTLVMDFVLSLKDFAADAVNAARRGVEVKFYLDAKESGNTNIRKFLVWMMQKECVEVRVNSGAGRRMHRKTIIFDFKTVMFGTACLSKHAFERNQEDITFGGSETYTLHFLQVLWPHRRYWPHVFRGSGSPPELSEEQLADILNARERQHVEYPR